MKKISFLFFPLGGLITGVVAFSSFATLPVSLLIIPLWYYSPGRLLAGLTIFLYFSSAAWSLPFGSAEFFDTNIWIAILDLFLAVLIPSIPFVLFHFKNKKHRVGGLIMAMILIIFPPFGLTSWSHPLMSTGVWLPGTGWAGIIITIFLMPVLCYKPVFVVIPIISGIFFANTHSCLIVPQGWKGLDTEFSGNINRRAEFTPLVFEDLVNDLNQQKKIIEKLNDPVNKKYKYILLPEGVGGTWLPGTTQLWNHNLRWPGTVIIGATSISGNLKDNVVLSISQKKVEIIYKQRQPVPLSMWFPGKEYSFSANWFYNPVVIFNNKKVAFFICYEQFLIWVILHSMLHDPELILAVSNVWWARKTQIPMIQNNIMKSWSRLFSLPLITANNY